MSFFFALIVHISSSVRQRIWFKESGNLSVMRILFCLLRVSIQIIVLQLMRTMGMNESSDLASWIMTTFLELSIVFFLAVVILYTGGIMKSSNKILIYMFLLIFGLCIITFRYTETLYFRITTLKYLEKL